MSKKQSQNPMQYRIRSASGTINKYFRKIESAEAYYSQVINSNINEIVVLEDLFAKEIIKDNSKSLIAEVKSTIETCTSDEIKGKPYVYHYKDGKLVREVLEENSKKNNKFIVFIKKLFNKE